MFRSLVILELFFLLGSGSVYAQPDTAVLCPGPRAAAFPNPQQSDAAERLTLAVRENRLAEITRLLDTGASPNGVDMLGTTPLLYAALAGNAAVTRLLLQHGANPRQTQPQTCDTALHYGVAANNPEVIHLLLAAGASADAVNRQGQTPLQLAVVRGFVEPGEALLAGGATVDLLDSKGNSALDNAVRKGRTPMLELLIRHHANIYRAHGVNGRTPIDEACMRDLPGAVEALAAAGAPVSEDDLTGQTPLDLALDYGSTHALRSLLQLAADRPALETNFADAMERAVLRGRTGTARLLAECGWDVNRPTPAGATYLNDAALKGYSGMVKLLLEHGAQPNAVNAEGNSALHDAALGGNAEVLRLLLDHGSRIDARTRETGATPLMLAAEMGRQEAVLLLLHRGANPRLTDKDGHTALDRAQANSDVPLVQLLKQFLSPAASATKPT